MESLITIIDVDNIKDYSKFNHGLPNDECIIASPFVDIDNLPDSLADLKDRIWEQKIDLNNKAALKILTNYSKKHNSVTLLINSQDLKALVRRLLDDNTEYSLHTLELIDGSFIEIWGFLSPCSFFNDKDMRKIEHIDGQHTNIICVSQSEILGDLQKTLFKTYKNNVKVLLLWALAPNKIKIKKTCLNNLEQFGNINNQAYIIIPNTDIRELNGYTFDNLVSIMKALRGENGCPWDKQQTHDSLKQYLVEETYEVLEAIDNKNDERIYDELGDLLLQIVFHAQIASEQGRFTWRHVVTAICNKMINRHTHIFGEAQLETAQQVLHNWEKLKKQEKGIKTHTQVLKDIPRNLPALMRSYKVQHKASLVGFDWDKAEDAIDKIDEELRELKSVYFQGNYGKISEEIGDLLFAVVNVARFARIEPELALTDAINKFIRRFAYIEKKATESKRKLDQMNVEEMDFLWNQYKNLYENKTKE
ncbi:MAG: nucleoside triphosphate pyrophosphohydrolase [Mahellales bacterium]|jgi:tetrapyrrole methylase family protein/MazG family protein